MKDEHNALPTGADVVVVGGGSTGAAAARACALRGLRVVMLDRRPLEEAGATWVNTIAGWQYDEAGVERSTAPERIGGGGPSLLIAGFGPTRVRLPPDDLIEADMRLLIKRLQREAVDAGAELFGGVRVGSVQDGAADAVVRTSRGSVRCRWVVDASGLAGRVGPPKPVVGPEHLCVAAQEVRQVADQAGLREYFAKHGATPEDTLSFTAMHGGFSLIAVRTHGDQLALLMGSVPGEGVPSGRQMLERFAHQHAWVGERVFGGAAAIPLRRSFDQLAVGRVARIGDAGCQVFPAHGSGVGPSLIAARMLADALADGRGAHGYGVQWQRAWGGHHAAHDLFRRFSQAQDAEELARMMTLGLLDAETAAAGVAQRSPQLPLRRVPAKLRGMLQAPELARRVVQLAAKMAAVHALYAAYPSQPALLPAWSRAIAAVFGEPPDIRGEAHVWVGSKVG